GSPRTSTSPRKMGGVSKTDETQDFASLLDAFEKEQQQGKKDRRGPKPGDMVEGTIVGFGEEAAFVDLGGKSEGSIPLVELTDAAGKRTAAAGDRIEALVVAVDDDARTGGLLVSGGHQRA